MSAHVHVKYAEHKCLLTLDSVTVYAGLMPVDHSKKRRRMSKAIVRL